MRKTAVAPAPAQFRPQLLIHRIGGQYGAVLGYTVASIDALGMRITQTRDLLEAYRTRTEWAAGDYSFAPGELRVFPVNAPAP